MGCASSSPLTVNGGPGGLVESAKTAATEIMSTGEKAMNGKILFSSSNSLVNQKTLKLYVVSHSYRCCSTYSANRYVLAARRKSFCDSFFPSSGNLITLFI